jgi:hypothetical protein
MTTAPALHSAFPGPVPRRLTAVPGPGSDTLPLVLVVLTGAGELRTPDVGELAALTQGLTALVVQLEETPAPAPPAVEPDDTPLRLGRSPSTPAPTSPSPSSAARGSTSPSGSSGCCGNWPGRRGAG